MEEKVGTSGGLKMFIGEYTHAIDTKGRLIIPAKFRKELGDTFYITKGMDHCLFVYPEKEWQAVGEKIGNLSLTRKEARAVQRLFYSGAMEAQPDRQYRVLIQPNLREYASIDKEVVLIGIANRIEIWDVNRWNDYLNEEDMDYDDLTAKLTDLEI